MSPCGVAVAWVFAVAVALGVGRGWSQPTLAALAAGGAVQTLVALGFAIGIGRAADKRKLLFVPALLGVVCVVALYAAGFALGAT